jgi:predicted nucleic acid-binding protein
VTGVYLDASAIVKLGTAESESLALRTWLRERGPVLTSRVSTVEVARAIRRKAGSGVDRGRAAAREAFTSVALTELDTGIADRAAEIGPASLRALDAIHLATALALGDELAVFVTYDTRLADAARAVGLEVIAPA